MKNAIKYFYNLDVDSIRQVDNTFFLLINKNNYSLEQVDEDIDLETKNELLKNNFMFNQIIRNNNNQLITTINNKLYALILTKQDNKIIDLVDIYKISNIYQMYPVKSPVVRCIELWQNKIDYLEYQMSQIGKKYPIIRESFSYYCGLSENSIQILKTISDKNIITCISHNRIRCDDTLNDLYNPLKIILDSRIRDTSEYFKSLFFNKKLNIDDIKYYFTCINLNEIQFFFCRMIFPSYYFDEYEKIIKGEQEEKSLLKYVNKVDDYEEFITYLYNYIKDNYSIVNIEWLKKT